MGEGGTAVDAHSRCGNENGDDRESRTHSGHSVNREFGRRSSKENYTAS